MSTGVCRRCTRTRSSIARDGLCWSCRERLAAPGRRRVRTAKRRAEIRRPPRPPYEGAAGIILVDGQLLGRRCALCGDPVPRGRRSWCSQECVDLWNLAVMPAIQRRHLVAIHGPLCGECGAETPDLEVDHHRPLWALTDTERLELKWWLPFNLMLLCHPCHRKKSAREAAARAQLRRSQALGHQVRYAG